MAVAIKTEPEDGFDECPVVVDGLGVHVIAGTSFPATMAAARLKGVPQTELVPMITRYLDMGSEAVDQVRTSATLRYLETQVGGLAQKVTESILDELDQSRALSHQALDKTLVEFANKLTVSISRYLDDDSQSSIPSIVRQQVADAGQKILRDVASLVGDGEDGALGRVKSQIARQIEDSTTRILTQTAARTALLTQSNLGGPPFEVALTDAVSMLLRPSNDVVDRCGDKTVAGRRAPGDILVTLNPAFTSGEVVRVVLEAKHRGERAPRFTTEAISKMLREAREARGASSGVFVADTADVLPDGMPFGQVNSGDYFTVFSGGAGGDIGLAAALYLARAHALLNLAAKPTGIVDVPAARGVIQRVRTAMERLASVEAEHSKASNAIRKAGAHCEDLRSEVIGNLRLLDDLLVAAQP